MGQEFSTKAFNTGFPHSGADATVVLEKDPAMAPSTEPDENGDAAPAAADRPHASDWLWRPWHAKLWWSTIVIYWAGMLGSFYSSALVPFYASALAGFLNIAFFPPLALIVLGLGFARAWFDWSDWEFVEPTHAQMFPKRSIGGMRDPASDPLDPRSGLHWQHFHRHR